MSWTKFRSPVPALDLGWERASAVLEAEVRRAAAEWRGEGGVPGGAGSEAAALAGRALLALGDRDATKDLIRAAALAAKAGRVAAPAVPALLRFLADFRAWTGDEEFLARYPEGIGRLAAHPEPVPQSLVEAAPDTAVGWGLVGEVVERHFGLAPEAPAGRLTVRPAPPAGWGEMELTGVRVGATSLDLRVRRGPGRLVLRVSRAHGPRLRLLVQLPADVPVRQATLDDEPLGAARAAFDAGGEHEVRFELD